MNGRTIPVGMEVSAWVTHSAVPKVPTSLMYLTVPVEANGEDIMQTAESLLTVLTERKPGCIDKKDGTADAVMIISGNGADAVEVTKVRTREGLRERDTKDFLPGESLRHQWH